MSHRTEPSGATKTLRISVAESELTVLRWLVSGKLGASADASERASLDRLDEYEFQDSNHRILFGALRSISHLDAAAIREHLPSLLVRAGFPDVDFEYLFQREPVSRMEAMRTLRQLIGGIGARY